MEVRWWSTWGGDVGVVVKVVVAGGKDGVEGWQRMLRVFWFWVFFFERKGKRKREIKGKPKQKNLSEKWFRSD